MKIKIVYLSFVLLFLPISLFAFGSIGKDNDPYFENGVEWQDVHEFWGYDPYRGNCKTHLPGKIALLRPFASILLGRPTWGRPRQMERGSFAATYNWPQNHQFFRAKQFCNHLYTAALPGKPFCYIRGGFNWKSLYNGVIYKIYSSTDKHWPDSSLSFYVRHLESCYAGPDVEIIPVSHDKKYVLYIVDIIRENCWMRYVQCGHGHYLLTVEGSDFSVAPAFFEKFEIIGDYAMG